MPNINGLELMATLRAEKSFNQYVPVIMITAVDSEKNVKEAIQAGGKGYIIKPFTQAALESQIQAAQGQ